MFGVLKSVSKHTIIYGIGDWMASGLSFMLIPLYTHYLTPSEYGVLEFLDLTTIIVSTILAMGIAQAVYRYYYQFDDKHQRDQVVSGALIILGVVLAIAIPLLIIFSSQISTLVLDTNDYQTLFIIAFISMGIGLLNSIPTDLMRIKEQSTLYVSYSSVKLLITLSLNILFIVKFEMGVAGILWSGLISATAGGLFLAAYTFRQISLSWSFDIAKQMLKYSFPLIWSWFAMFIMNYGDRFLLQKFCTLADVGIYALSYKFGMIANVLVMSPFLMTWRPKQFAIYKEPDAKDTYSHVFTYFMLAFVYVSLGISVLVEDVIGIMADPEYHTAYKYVPIILVSYISFGVYNFVQFGVHIKNKTKFLGMTTITAACVNIGLNLWLTPRYAIWGATLSTVGSFLVLPLIIYPLAQRCYHISYQFGRLIKLLLTAVGLFFAALFIDIESVALSIVLKFLIAFSFPFLLFLLGFYTAREREKMALIWGQLVDALKRRKNDSGE